MKNEIKELSFEFGLTILKHHSKLLKKQMAPLASQLLRSGTAVGALYREAQFAQSRADFINKLSIARKECNESIYWMDLLQASGYIENSDYTALSKQAGSLLKILSSIIQSTRNRALISEEKSVIRNP
ncbi:MAG: four helix bundle protein [Flavobacteriales bacterium]|jgi:four helix bundle protein